MLPTSRGTCWYFKARGSDGVQVTRRGFASERAARDAKRRLVEQAEAVDGEEIAPKTINNTLGTLVACLNAAVEDGLIASNPALRVERLPMAHI